MVLECDIYSSKYNLVAIFVQIYKMNFMLAKVDSHLLQMLRDYQGGCMQVIQYNSFRFLMREATVHQAVIKFPLVDF